MASKRITKTAIDWNRFQKLVPSNQQAFYQNALSKNFQYVSKVVSLPDALPAIDFDSYKKQLANPAVLEKLEKGYKSYQVPYPKDSENVVAKINEQEQAEGVKIKKYLEELQSSITSLKAQKETILNIPPIEEMTVELADYYFPSQSKIDWDKEIGVDEHKKFLEPSKHHH